MCAQKLSDSIQYRIYLIFARKELVLLKLFFAVFVIYYVRSSFALALRILFPTTTVTHIHVHEILLEIIDSDLRDEDHDAWLS